MPLCMVIDRRTCQNWARNVVRFFYSLSTSAETTTTISTSTLTSTVRLTNLLKTTATVKMEVTMLLASRFLASLLVIAQPVLDAFKWGGGGGLILSI